MHAFDADKLHGDDIFVRAARAGERIAALNGESYTLDPSNLVIADSERSHRDRRSHRRRGQRDLGFHHAHRSRKRQLQRLQHAQNFLAAEAPHRRVHAL